MSGVLRRALRPFAALIGAFVFCMLVLSLARASVHSSACRSAVQEDARALQCRLSGILILLECDGDSNAAARNSFEGESNTHTRQHGNDDDDANDARETRRRLSGNHRCTRHTRVCDWCVFVRVSGDRMEKGRRRKGASPSDTLLLERKVRPCMALAYAPAHVNSTRSSIHIHRQT